MMRGTTRQDVHQETHWLAGMSLGMAVLALTLVAVIAFGVGRSQAEQSGSTPESNATSYLKSLNDSLVGSGYGSTTNSPDWGSVWNRIATAAEWAPDGTATANDVVSGKTAYTTSRTAVTGAYSTANLSNNNVVSGVTYGVSQTGSRVVGGPCSTQLYDDSHGTPVTLANSCSQTWTAASPTVTGDDATGQDPVTGLRWSKCLIDSSGTVGFSTISCNLWTWDASGTSNVAVGNQTAIQLCSNLGNGWRLPGQKELMQAYIDGSAFSLSKPFYVYWSSTPQSASYAWQVELNNGQQEYYSESNVFDVRCVR